MTHEIFCINQQPLLLDLNPLFWIKFARSSNFKFICAFVPYKFALNRISISAHFWSIICMTELYSSFAFVSCECHMHSHPLSLHLACTSLKLGHKIFFSACSLLQKIYLACTFSVSGHEILSSACSITTKNYVCSFLYFILLFVILFLLEPVMTSLSTSYKVLA